MKALLSSLMIAALAIRLAPEAQAQHVVASGYHRTHVSGYVSSRVWVPGRYETICERVFVPGAIQRVWVEPVYEWRFDGCGLHCVCARGGYWKTVQLPGHYENRSVRVFRPGHWSTRGSCD